MSRAQPVTPQRLARLRRVALDALRRDFPGWAFLYEAGPPGRWVAAPGHPLMPRLRILNSSERVQAPDATALRVALAPLPPRRRR